MKKLLISTAVVAALIGCSSEEQDSPQSPVQEINPVVSGIVIDPFVTGSVIFADYDNDDILDPFEPRALTDKDGYFGVSAEGVDYCTIEHSDYCLTLTSANPVTIKAVGGYDRSTLSKLNTRFSVNYQGSENANVVISPLSTLSNLTVDNDDMVMSDTNFMMDPLADEMSIKSLRLAFSVQLIVDELTQMLSDEYPEIGDHEDLPSDLSGFIYQALANIGEQKQQSIETLLTDVTVSDVSLLLAIVEDELATAYTEASLPSKSISNKLIKSAFIEQAVDAIDTVSKQILTIDNANAIVDYIDSNDDVIIENVSGHIVSGLTKATQGIGELAFNAPEVAKVVGPIYTPEVLTVIANDNFNANALDAGYILAQVITQGVDITDIEAVADVVSDIVSNEDLTLDANALPSSLANHQLTFAQYSEKDIIANLAFGGDIGAEQGTLTACVKYQDNQDPEDELNTQGKLLTGSWQKLSDYHFTVSMEIAGATQVSQVAKITDLTFSFDFDDEVREYSSVSGIEVQTGDIASSDAQCQSILEVM